MLGCFGSLMSMPGGRALVVGLVNGSKTVTIGPTSTRRVASANRGAGSLENPDGTAGAAAPRRSASTPTSRTRAS